MARLTLCIIARDEEKMLPACLQSVRGVVDEVVLVDTGSRDGTMEVARRHGARVYERPWDDDFAAPRNLALAHARGEYVLQLDADERLAPGAGAVLRRELARGDLRLGLLPLHNAARADAPPERVISGELRLGNLAWVPRLMRRTADLRYEGAIHESVEECLLRQGVRSRAVEADIIHLGFMPEVRANRKKRERNLSMLRRRCQLEPDSITPFGFLAMELYETGSFAEAQEVAERGWALLATQPPYRSAALVAAVRGAVALRTGDVERVLDTSRGFREREGVYADLEFLRGAALTTLALRHPAGDPARASRLEEAVAAFREALAPRPYGETSFIAGVRSWASWLRLGHALLAAGRHREARAAFDEVLLARPGDDEARLGLAEISLDAGDASGCLASVEPLLGDRCDGWLLAAAAAHALGSKQDALLFLRQARERCRDGYAAPHRHERHNALARALSAA
jgi:tetratricopeptide (TPR) repeat protein